MYTLDGACDRNSCESLNILIYIVKLRLTLWYTLFEPRHAKTGLLHICENKDADQFRGNREADQRLCFRYTDSTIPLPPTSEISSL